jgi:DNA polymerase III subunit epsilon
MFQWLRRQREEWQQRYLQNTPGKNPVDAHSVRFCVIDTETTGFDIHKDRILSVAVAIMENDLLRVDRIRHWMVFQTAASLNEAVKVHGILPSESQMGVSEAQMLRELIPLLNGSILVGHHITFDASMINLALERHFAFSLRNRFIDTAQLAMSEIDAFKKTSYSNQRPPNLDEVCLQLNIEPLERHTAVGDVFTTAQVFLNLKGKMQHRMGPKFSLRKLPMAKA